MRKHEKFELIFCAANVFIEAVFFDKIKTRFDFVFPDSGLPLQLETDIFPIPVHIDRVLNAPDCTDSKNKHVLDCFKTNLYCDTEFWLIAEKLRSMFKIDKDKKFVCIFISPFANTRDSHGDILFDNKKNNGIMTIAFQRLDAIISTVLHELFELVFIKSKKDIHCTHNECYMNPDSVALRLCPECLSRVQKKIKK